MKKTQYGGYVVMFIPNKIIKNKKLNYPHVVDATIPL